MQIPPLKLPFERMFLGFPHKRVAQSIIVILQKFTRHEVCISVFASYCSGYAFYSVITTSILCSAKSA